MNANPDIKVGPLRARRVLKGASLYDVSSKTGIVVSRLSLLERGLAKIKRAEIRRLAEALGCEPFELFLPPEVS